MKHAFELTDEQILRLKMGSFVGMQGVITELLGQIGERSMLMFLIDTAKLLQDKEGDDADNIMHPRIDAFIEENHVDILKWIWRDDPKWEYDEAVYSEKPTLHNFLYAYLYEAVSYQAGRKTDAPGLVKVVHAE